MREWEETRMTRRLLAHATKQEVGLPYWDGGDWKTGWQADQDFRLRSVNLRYLAMVPAVGN